MRLAFSLLCTYSFCLPCMPPRNMEYKGEKWKQGKLHTPKKGISIVIMVTGGKSAKTGAPAKATEVVTILSTGEIQVDKPSRLAFKGEGTNKSIGMFIGPKFMTGSTQSTSHDSRVMCCPVEKEGGIHCWMLRSKAIKRGKGKEQKNGNRFKRENVGTGTTLNDVQGVTNGNRSHHDPKNIWYTLSPQGGRIGLDKSDNAGGNDRNKKKANSSFQWYRQKIPKQVSTWKVKYPGYTLLPDGTLWVFGEKSTTVEFTHSGKWKVGPSIKGCEVMYGTMSRIEHHKFLVTGLSKEKLKERGALFTQTQDRSKRRGRKPIPPKGTRNCKYIKHKMPTERWNHVAFLAPSISKNVLKEHKGKKNEGKGKGKGDDKDKEKTDTQSGPKDDGIKINGVVLAGGSEGSNVNLYGKTFTRPYSKSTLVYDIKNQKFFYGPDLPRYFEAGDAITIEKDETSSTFLIGGSRMYEFQGIIEYSHKKSEFYLLKGHLSVPRFGALAVEVPNDFFPKSLLKKRSRQKHSTKKRSSKS